MSSIGSSSHDPRLNQAGLLGPDHNVVHGNCLPDDELKMIIDALTNAYDLVLVECGPADEMAVEKIAGRDGAEIILSAPSVSDERIVEVLTGFGAAGYRDIVLMTGQAETDPDYPDRDAA